MPNMLFANNANTTLASGITSSATSITVTSSTAFPNPVSSQYFYCTLADAATQQIIEIIQVTAVSGTTWTVVRGQDGTTGTAYSSGAIVSLRLVRASLNDFPKLDENNTFTYAPTFNTALAVGSGGTGLTSLTAGYIPYGNGTSAFSSSANLTWNGSLFNVNGTVNIGAGTAYGTGLTVRPATNDYQLTLLQSNAAGAGWGLFADTSGNLNITRYGGSAYGTPAISSTLGALVSFSNAITVTNTGKFGTTVGVGAAAPAGSGAGITFPATQSASSDANTLDDYEEGTWTPVITGASTAGTGVYVLQQGSYTKIGNQVTVWFRILWTAHTGTGSTIVTGLPFTINAANVSFDFTAIGSQSVAYTSGKTLVAGWGATGLTYTGFDIGQVGASATYAVLAMAITGDLFGSVTYFV